MANSNCFFTSQIAAGTKDILKFGKQRTQK